MYQAATAILGATKVEKLIEINKRGRTWSLPFEPMTTYGEMTSVYFSSDGGFIMAASGKIEGQQQVILHASSTEALKPEEVAENKANFKKYSTSGSGNIDGL